MDQTVVNEWANVWFNTKKKLKHEVIQDYCSWPDVALVRFRTYFSNNWITFLWIPRSPQAQTVYVGT